MKRILMSTLLSTSILHGAWAMDPEAAANVAPLLASIIINGEGAQAEHDGNKSVITVYSSDFSQAIPVNEWTDLNTFPIGSIAVIEIIGPIVKYDSWYNYGTKGYQEQLRLVNAHKNVSAIIIKTDSPGGMVSGTQELADFIKNNVDKPTICFIDGLGASAAYWIASACDEIYAINATSEIGSIGVMMSGLDLIPYFEKAGAKYYEEYATKSTEKNSEFRQLRQGKPAPMITERLDPLNEVFHTAIKTNRPNVAPEAFTGKIYFANDAIDAGLIDGIMSFDDCILRAEQLSKGTIKARVI